MKELFCLIFVFFLSSSTYLYLNVIQASQILHASSDVVTLVVMKDNGVGDGGESAISSRCDRQRELDLISPASTGKDESGCSSQLALPLTRLPELIQ